MQARHAQMHDAGTRQQWVYDRDYLYFDENVFRIKKWTETYIVNGEQMIDRFQMNKSAIVFAMAGVGSWFWPPSDASTGDGHIVAAIFLVGATILWFMPTSSNQKWKPPEAYRCLERVGWSNIATTASHTVTSRRSRQKKRPTYSDGGGTDLLLFWRLLRAKSRSRIDMRSREMFDFLLHVIVWGLVLLFVVWLIGVIIGNL
jgi:hypothetical protein